MAEKEFAKRKWKEKRTRRMNCRAIEYERNTERMVWQIRGLFSGSRDRVILLLSSPLSNIKSSKSIRPRTVASVANSLPSFLRVSFSSFSSLRPTEFVFRSTGISGRKRRTPTQTRLRSFFPLLPLSPEFPSRNLEAKRCWMTSPDNIGSMQILTTS